MSRNVSITLQGKAAESGVAVRQSVEKLAREGRPQEDDALWRELEICASNPPGANMRSGGPLPMTS